MQLTGRVSVHPRGFGFVTDDTLPFDAPDASAFVAPPDMNALLADDVVRCDVEVAGERRTAKRVVVLHRRRTRLAGTLLHRGAQAFLHVDRIVANTDWPLDGAPADVPPGAVVVARIDGARVVFERAATGTDAEIELLLARHDLPGEHAPAVLAAAGPASAQLTPTDLASRRDLRGVVTVTIDSASTKDIDDALLAFPPDDDGAVRVIVAIADVARVVAPGTALDDDARMRTTSVYLPGRTLPMLPRALSEDALSLTEGTDRAVLTAELRIDVEGRVTAVDLHEAVIRSTAQLTYDAVARFLAEDDEAAVPAATHETLRLLRAAAARLSQARAERGGRQSGSELEREEIAVFTDDAGAPTALEVRRTDVAQLLVERLMVAANEAVARWLVERGLPGVYRVHEAPTLERSRQLAEAAAGLGVVAGFSHKQPLSPKALAAFDHQLRGSRHERALDAALRRLLGPARYDPVPSMHFGLAAPLYLHFTSPIRRYADLVVHRIIRGYLRGERASSPPELVEVCARMNDMARRAAKAETERERVLVARLYGGRIGERVRGVVVGNKPQGALVQIDGALAMLPGPARAVGEAVDVTIASVDETLGRIDVALADAPATR